MARVVVERTIAGTFYYPAGYKRAEVPMALHWYPGERISVYMRPFAAGGFVTRMDNERFAYAKNAAAAKLLAEEFFADGEGHERRRSLLGRTADRSARRAGRR